VPGRSKSDVLDCQWIRKLHSFGLFNGSFCPDQQIRKLSTYMRLKDNLVVEATQAIHHMQKRLFEMNVQLSNVISDITGESGLRIIEAILAGERDPEQLGALCSTRIKASRQTVAKSLRQLATSEIKTPLSDSKQNLQTQLHQICGVDLTKIPGIKEQALIIISEVGLDMTRWNTEKQFSSFLGFMP
jgi:transposase